MYSVPFWRSIFIFLVFLFYVLIILKFLQNISFAENAISEPIIQLGMQEQ
jgi:hypothetical protein